MTDGPPPEGSPRRSSEAGSDPVSSSDLDQGWLRQEIERLNNQVSHLAATLANQQSVFVDIAGARTAELKASLSEVEASTALLKAETQRLRQLEDAIAHHLHDLVLDVVQPELRSQLGQQLPQLVVAAMAPELRRAVAEWLPQIVLDTVNPELRHLLSEWLPVLVADSVQPEVRQAVADRLPDITAAVVQPEVRRVLAERLPHLVADTVQPELYRTLAERLPAVMREVVTPEVRAEVVAHLPQVVSEAVRPEVRGALEARLPDVVADVVTPEVRRVLAERLPELVAETVQPELRQTLAERLPHLVSETVRPEVRDSLNERLPGVVAQVVIPDVRHTLAERLPQVVADTVQPELRQVLGERLPGILAEVVSPSVGSLLADRIPGMLAEIITPDLTATLAEVESSSAELRQEAAKMRGLREVVSERLPETIMAVVEPQLQEVLAVRFPRLVSEVVDPVLREILSVQLPDLVARAVQPDVSRQLGEQVPQLVADTIRPELQQAVAAALEERLPDAVSAAVRPELHDRLAEALPAVVGEVVTPQLLRLVTERLPAVVSEVVTPELTVSLAAVEGTAAEMRAETDRLRGLREVISERLPRAVMTAVETVLESTVEARLPELLYRVVQPAVSEALGAPLPAALHQVLEPALRQALGQELPDLVSRALERQVQIGLAESLPSLVASSTEPGVRAALAGIETSVGRLDTLREEVLNRLGGLVPEAGNASLAEFQSSAAELREQAESLRNLREDMLRELPRLVEERVAAPLSEFGASAAHLRVEAERLRNLRQEVVDELPRLGRETLAAMVADFEESAALLRAEAEQLAALRQELLLRPRPEVGGGEPSGGKPHAPASGTAGAGGAAASTAEPALSSPPEGRPVEAAQWPPEDALWGPARDLPAEEAEFFLEPRPEPPEGATGESEPAPFVPPEAIVEPAAWAPGEVSWEPPPPPPQAEPEVEPEAEAGAEAAEAAEAAEPGPDDEGPAEPPATPGADGEPAVDPGLAAALAPQRPNGGRAGEATETDEELGGNVCVLPGVVVGLTLARGVGEAMTRARLRRRRRRRAGPPAAGLHRRDPFAGELVRRLEWFAQARRQDANSPESRAQGPGHVPIGDLNGKEAVFPLVPLGGLCLVGPRAREAARAVVLSFLAANSPEVARAIVVGDLLPAATMFPGLGRTRDVAAVMSGLQAEAARRQGLFATAGVADIDAYHALHPDERLPLILLAAELTSADASRLKTLLAEGAPTGIIGLVADALLDGMPTLRLQSGARVADQSPGQGVQSFVGARLFTVEREPAAELLEVLASARSDVDGEVAPPAPDAPFEVVPAASAAINVRILGGYRIDVDGREIRSGLRAKARELLAFYLLHPEGTTLEEATEALWPEADPRRGSEWFWTALGNLRSRLRSATENSELKVIEREGDRYRIEPVFDVDLWRFQAALGRAGASSGDPSWGQTLQEAAALYAGELLAGASWPWAEVAREDLRGRAVDVLVSMAATQLVAGDVRGALDALERAVEVDPLAEQLYRRIMRLHAKLSHPDQADATYRTLQARLEEIELEPSPESEKLYRELCGTG